MDFFDFIKGIGRALASAFSIIKKVVPEEHLLAGIELAEAAAIKFADNAERRAWVIAQLRARLGIPEGIARLIVELAVLHLKRGVAKAADEADGTVKPI